MANTDRAPVLAEAGAYIGIVAMLSGAALAAYPSRLNPDAALAAALAAVFWAAAAAVPDRPGPSSVRIRSALLVASLLPFAECIALCTGDGLGWGIRAEAMATAGATLAVASLLWRLHRRLPQQAAVLIFATATAGLATTYLAHDSLPLAGAASWALGSMWFVLAWGSTIAPRRGAMVLGAITALLGAGAVMLVGTSVLVVATILVLVLIAVAFRDLVLLILASAAALIVLPFALGRLFSSPSPPAVLLAVAGGVLVAGVLVATRRPVRRGEPTAADADGQPDAPDAALGGRTRGWSTSGWSTPGWSTRDWSTRDWSTGPRRTAVVIAVVIAAAVASVIATVGH